MTPFRPTIAYSHSEGPRLTTPPRELRLNPPGALRAVRPASETATEHFRDLPGATWTIAPNARRNPYGDQDAGVSSVAARCEGLARSATSLSTRRAVMRRSPSDGAPLMRRILAVHEPLAQLGDCPGQSAPDRLLIHPQWPCQLGQRKPVVEPPLDELPQHGSKLLDHAPDSLLIAWAPWPAWGRRGSWVNVAGVRSPLAPDGRGELESESDLVPSAAGPRALARPAVGVGAPPSGLAGVGRGRMPVQALLRAGESEKELQSSDHCPAVHLFPVLTPAPNLPRPVEAPEMRERFVRDAKDLGVARRLKGAHLTPPSEASLLPVSLSPAGRDPGRTAAGRAVREERALPSDTGRADEIRDGTLEGITPSLPEFPRYPTADSGGRQPPSRRSGQPWTGA